MPDTLWDGLGDRIPSHLHELRTDGRLVIGVTSEPHHRISISFEEDGSSALLIRQDLMALIYRVLRVIVASTGLNDGRETSPAGFDADRLAQVLADILWWYWKTGTIFGPSYPITESQKHLAGILATETERFFLCHELVHVLVRHGLRPEPTPEQLIGTLISGTFPSALEDIPPWEEELFADTVGLQMVLGLLTGHVSEHGGTNQLRYAGAEAMLHIDHALETLGLVRSESHPPAKHRVAALRDFVAVSASPEQATLLRMFGEMIEGKIDHALAIITSEQQDPRYAQEAQLALADIDAAFTSCTRSNPPDYFSFYSAMTDILGRGYFHVTLEHLADAMRSWRPHDFQSSLAKQFAVSQASIPGEEPPHELRDFFKFKLALGYFLRQQDTPVGRYMLSIITGGSAA